MEIKRCYRCTCHTDDGTRLYGYEKNERGPRHRATAYSYKYIMVSRLKLDFERARALSSQHTVIVGEVRVYTHRERHIRHSA